VRLILTPSHHRVHHARNPLYIDTNFCNLLNIWDRIFRTYQPEDHSLQIEYGVTRPVNPRSFVDLYFGEFVLLARDIAHAPGLKNKFLYFVARLEPHRRPQDGPYSQTNRRPSNAVNPLPPLPFPSSFHHAPAAKNIP
jgi:hypothetical protein